MPPQSAMHFDSLNVELLIAMLKRTLKLHKKAELKKVKVIRNIKRKTNKFVQKTKLHQEALELELLNKQKSIHEKD